MNTHETYVSLDTAKRLRKAGFDWVSDNCYMNDNGNLFDRRTLSHYVMEEDTIYMAPTLSVAQKWLREVKNMLVSVSYDTERKWNYTSVFDMSIEDIVPCDMMSFEKRFWSYEEALETGINKCLNYLLENKNNEKNNVQ